MVTVPSLSGCPRKFIKTPNLSVSFLLPLSNTCLFTSFSSFLIRNGNQLLRGEQSRVVGRTIHNKEGDDDDDDDDDDDENILYILVPAELR